VLTNTFIEHSSVINIQRTFVLLYFFGGKIHKIMSELWTRRNNRNKYIHI